MVLCMLCGVYPAAAYAQTPAVGYRTLCLVAQGQPYRTSVYVDWPHLARSAPYGGWRGYVDRLLDNGADLVQVGNAVAQGLGDALEARLRRDETPARNATAQAGAHAPYCTAHVIGWQYDRRQAALALADALDGAEPEALTLQPYNPAVTLQQVRHCTRKLAEFSTLYNVDNVDRSHNLQLAAAAVNGYVVPPDEEFSFNRAVGERTVQRGYRAAPSIVRGRYIDTVGGGVCQLSTTLYNAALLAGLRACAAPHSMTVHYVAAGRDAMVSAASDMTFANITGSPLYVYADAVDGRLTVRLYGLAVAQSVRLNSRFDALPYRNIDEKGCELQDTTGYECLQQGHNGGRAVLERWCDGNKQVLRRCVYAPIDAVWRKRGMTP